MIITEKNTPIFLKKNGTYVMTRPETGDLNYWCGFPDDENGCHSEVESYLLDHPEALIPEPVPPEPTQEELDAMEVQTAKSYLASTDWIVAKIGEAQMNGQNIAPLLEKYAEDLQKREEARATINKLDR